MKEETYLIFHPTRLAYLRWHLASTFIITFSVSLFFFMPLQSLLSGFYLYILIFFIVASVFLIITAELLRRNDKYAITSYRVIEKSGIINIEEDSVYWEKLSNYELTQNFFDRIFNIGTIKLWSTGGEDKPEVIIRQAPNVKKIRFLLDKLIQKR